MLAFTSCALYALNAFLLLGPTVPVGASPCPGVETPSASVVPPPASAVSPPVDTPLASVAPPPASVALPPSAAPPANTPPAASPPAASPPIASPPPANDPSPASSDYWLANIKRQGKPAFGDDPNYQIFRNVKDPAFGAVGDGQADDTEAINKAIRQAVIADVDYKDEKRRCGWILESSLNGAEPDLSTRCDSRTTQPAIVYFPPGTYRVTTPLIMYYYTQMIGDANNLPVIKADSNFTGMAVIDADPYVGEQSWWTNQNNFFRQVRNFVIDITAQPPTVGAGIHWQVAQATSLQNIRFEMVKGGEGNVQKGIFMDNGSGGFMSDLTFNGGGVAAFLGSQQFTSRNITINDAKVGVYLNWNWLWSFSGLTINNAEVGIDMAGGPLTDDGKGVNQTVGSLVLYDSKIEAKVGVNSSFSKTSYPTGGGTLYLNNVDFAGTPIAVQGAGEEQALAGNTVVESWMQGQQHMNDADPVRIQDVTTAPSKPAALLTSSGAIFSRSKPQYADLPLSKIKSILSFGAKGDGKTDDTAAIQNALDNIKEDELLYFDHGAYLITKTITIPSNKLTRITGEHWPLLLATGSFWSDPSTLKPVLQVGTQSGDPGALEMSDLIIGTAGPVPGATLMQWNLASRTAGESGIWDTHWRVGGYAGTQLDLTNCLKSNETTWTSSTLRSECQAAGLLFHATPQAGNIYLENTWFWVSDHDLDLPPWSQIDIFNARGVLIESTGASWWYGTASEHNVMYNYQLKSARNVFMSVIQTETPYYQGNPDATHPFAPQTVLSDPDFSKSCSSSSSTSAACKKSWGLRILDTSDFLLYGGGLYSFFENYGQSCVATNDCQENMVSLEGENKNVHLFGLSTKASVNMVTKNGVGMVLDKDNRSNFCATVGRVSVD